MGEEPHLISHRRLLDPAPRIGTELQLLLSPRPAPAAQPSALPVTALTLAAALGTTLDIGDADPTIPLARIHRDDGSKLLRSYKGCIHEALRSN